MFLGANMIYPDVSVIAFQTINIDRDFCDLAVKQIAHLGAAEGAAN
jgi:hypothetical protein